MKILVFSLCLAIIVVSSLQTTSIARNRKTGRIVGGQQANAGMFPYAAAVEVTTSTGKYFCGGALMGDQWIVTAGQCVDQAVSFVVHLGSNSLKDDDPYRLTLSTSTYVLHPNYDPLTLDNDIGLIHLRMPIEFTDYIKPVYSVPASDFPEGWQYLALGWGHTSDDDTELAEHLNWVSLTSITNEECRITYGSQVTDNMMCVAGNYNEGTCIGDTGSPLIYLIRYGNALIQGVASFVSGNGCESTDPSGYTRIFPHAQWIINVTGVPQG